MSEMTEMATEVNVAGLNLFRRGKVRDTYELSPSTLLMIATDRISAFDVVLPTPIPGKGRVLTQMSLWWFEQTRGIVPNHILPGVDEAVPENLREDWQGRAMLVRRAQRLDVECVVRGFISGSGWKEYRESGTLANEVLSPGLTESSRLPSPRFTPAVKNDTGHDVNISRAQLRDLVGRELAEQLESASLRLFDVAAARCEGAGIYLADTKFEFGHVDGTLTLIDEVFTPDSSRFWEISEWKSGGPVASFDKQFVRDYLETLGWDKTPPGPELPQEVVDGTLARYREAARRICGIDVT
ncbi:MAG TPA: phosphoribosylaminoimidazolesuccinocarboxamide synthase, partial [Candidatus Dormibacteraeota bacterium]|nr:phosphoribosylaminoimidazolesuccinocarboxamide synthase [Candidatus Dormibacteraeota bacterium]